MNAPIIQVHNLHRSFGPIQAVRGISFDVYRGQVLGFIGANGAGKTTTLRLLATLDLPTAGTITIEGRNAIEVPSQVRPHIGWMPDSYGTYPHVTIWEYLDFYARAYGMQGQQRLSRIQEVMEFTDLTPLQNRTMDHLSKGMSQRLCLGRTLLYDPSLLLLDEPAAGLDPKARLEFKNLIRLLASQKKTIVISSHILSELEEMCDSLLFIHQGEIVHHGETETLKRHHSTTLYTIHIQKNPAALTCQNHPSSTQTSSPTLSLSPFPIASTSENETCALCRLSQWLQQDPDVELLESHPYGARISFSSEKKDLIPLFLQRLLQAGHPVIDFHQEERRLEQAFIDLLTTKLPPPLPSPPFKP